MDKLEIGHRAGNIDVRTVELGWRSPEAARILYVSDLHFNKHSGRRARQLAEIVHQTNPDIVLWGGDYVDSASGLAHFADLLAAVPKQVLGFAVAGNHDHYFGIQKIEAILSQHGIDWIENTSVEVKVGGQIIAIDGNCSNVAPRQDAFCIRCSHRPVSPYGLEKSYDLILAGHLHGCQFVFWTNRSGLYPGRWFYRWNILEAQMGRCRYIVSRGIGDTLPLRFNCDREVILVLV
ncbi:MAG: metallophosphoesterase [Saprospiraceae bacterium]